MNRIDKSLKIFKENDRIGIHYIKGNDEETVKYNAESIETFNTALRSMETLREIKRIIDIDNSLIQEDVIKYKMICELVEKVFGKDSESK